MRQNLVTWKALGLGFFPFVSMIFIDLASKSTIKEESVNIPLEFFPPKTKTLWSLILQAECPFKAGTLSWKSILFQIIPGNSKLVEFHTTFSKKSNFSQSKFKKITYPPPSLLPPSCSLFPPSLFFSFSFLLPPSSSLLPHPSSLTKRKRPNIIHH